MGARFLPPGVVLFASDEGLVSVFSVVGEVAVGVKGCGWGTTVAVLACLKDSVIVDLYEGGLLKKSLISELMLVVALKAITLILFSGAFNSCGLRDEITFLSLFI